MNPFKKATEKIFSGFINKKAEEKLKSAVESAASAFGGMGSRNRHSTGFSGGQKFTDGLTNSGETIHFNHSEIRQNARKSAQDTPQVKMILETFGDTVVHTGLKLKAQPDAKILGITPEAAEEWADDTDRRFDMWAGSKDSDRSGVNTFYQNQRMYHIWEHRDNDQFTRFRYSKDKSLLNPLQLQFLDPNQIRGYAFTNSYSQIEFDDGIIRNADGKETGYKIWSYKNGKYTEKTIPARGPRSGRIMMVHGFNPEYAGQGRGYSGLAHVLQELSNLTDFKISHIMKAIQQTIYAMYVKPSKDSPASNPTNNAGAGPRPSDYDVDGEAVAYDGPSVVMETLPETTITRAGSTNIYNLKEGEDFGPVQQSAPVDRYDEFVDSYLSHISASMNMPVEVAKKKFEQNYSASRAALKLYWDTVIRLRAELKADLLDPVYESWLSEEIAAGRIQAPGWRDPRIKAAWLKSRWSGLPMPNIDPAKTAKADLMYMQMGAQTPDDIAETFNGSDGKTNRAKNRRQVPELIPFDLGVNSQADGQAQGQNGTGGANNQNAGNQNNAAFAPGMIEAIADAVVEKIGMME